MQKWIGIGRITKAPELTTTNNGISVCKFTLAVQRKFAKQDGEKVSDFFNIVAWRGLGENIAKYCKKGSKIFIAGELQNRSYDASDGSKRYITEIIANECEFIETKRNDNNIEETTTEYIPVSDDELPF